MKNFVLFIYLIVCIAMHVDAQPPFHVVPGNGTVTLIGTRGGVTTPTHVDVYRGASDPPTNVFATFPMTDNSYEWEDDQVQNGTLYYYRIKVRDENNGNESNFSVTDAAVPMHGPGSHALFDGQDDRVIRSFDNFLQDIRRIRFDLRIDEPHTGQNLEILRIENDFDQRPGGFSYNFTTLRLYHGASALVLEINVDNNRPNSNGSPGQSQYFSVGTRNIADGEWHTISIENIGLGRVGGRIIVDGNQYSIGNTDNRFCEIGFEGNHSLRLGGRSINNTTFFKGAIDNLKTFDGNGVLHDWKFNEPAALLTAFDSGPDNINLTMVSGATRVASNFGSIATIADDQGVSVHWDRDIDLPGESLQSYELWRKAGSGTLELLTTVAIPDTSYLDDQITIGETYEYEVRSVKTNGLVLRSQSDIAKPVNNFDQYLVLDGVGEVQASDAELFPNTSGTIEFRIKAKSEDVTAGTNYSVANKHDGSGSLNGFNFILDRSSLYVQVKGDDPASSRNIRSATPTSLIDGQWHHIAYTYQWGGTSTLYIDGVEEATIDDTPDVTLSQEPFRIGKSPATFWGTFKGSIDEVRIWDQALTSTEINDRKDQPIAGNEDGLQALWRFDTVTDGTAFDDGLNGFDAEIVGGLTTASLPTGEVHTSYDGSNVALEWSVQSTDPVQVYIISRTRLDIASDMEVLTVLPETASSYVDTDPVANAEYEYRIDAVTGNDESFIFTDFMATKQGLGNRLDFGSSGGLVEIDESITDTQQGTIEFRFRSDEDPPAGQSFALLSKTDATGSDNGFTFTHSSTAVFVQMKASGTTFNIFVNKDYLDGDWHHMALVYDWNGETNLYIDGQLEGSVTVNNLSITSQPLRVGSSISTFWALYVGQLDELRIWDKQLSSTEINASKDIRLPGNTTDLGGVWHFDEASGTTAHDNGAGNLDGALSGDVGFDEPVATLSFFSNNNGFTESDGNNGQIDGSMIIEITGDNSFVGPGEMNTNLYQLLNARDGGAVGSLFNGLTPVLNVSADGKQAELSFNNEADAHTAMESVSSVRIRFTNGAFQTDTKVTNQEAESNIPYVLLDNTFPFVTTPIQEFVSGTNFSPIVIDLADLFVDPDYAQPFTYEVLTSNTFVNATLNGTVLTISPNESGEGQAEITAVFNDGNGGEVAAAIFVYVELQDQFIQVDPISDIDLASQSTVQINATSSAGLAVDLEILDGDGSINASGLLTINTTGSFRIAANQPGTNTYRAAEEVIISFIAFDSRKTDQTITFEQVADATYGDEVAFSATASSGLNVNFELVSGAGTLSGNNLTVTGIGTYEIEATQQGNDTFNPAPLVTMSFEVSKASLSVTAENKIITEGDPIPELTLTYNGFKLADDASVLEVQPTVSTTATATSPVGDYAIVLEGGSDDVYELNLVNGTLTIEAEEEVLGVNNPGLTIYPNPVVDRLQIKGGEIVTMRLVSMDGKLIRSQNNTTSMDVSNLKQGNYVLQLIARTGEVSTHVIIKN